MLPKVSVSVANIWTTHPYYNKYVFNVKTIIIYGKMFVILGLFRTVLFMAIPQPPVNSVK